MSCAAFRILISGSSLIGTMHLSNPPKQPPTCVPIYIHHRYSKDAGFSFNSHPRHLHRTNRTARKLAEKKIGPFPIISQPSPLSFTIRLPSTIRIHPVFHVSQLEPEHPNTFEDRDLPPPPPLIVDGKPEYLIERIIDAKYNRARRKCSFYITSSGLVTRSPTTQPIGSLPTPSTMSPVRRQV